MANKIQIKRSVANSTVTGLSNGELAFTQASNTLHIGLPDGSGVLRIGGAQYPGTLTNSHALVANASGGIDKIIVSNAAITSVWANGNAGTDGQLLTSNGTVVYWNTPAPSVVGSDTQVQFNDGGSLGADSGLTFDKTTDTLSTNTVLATSTVNAATFSVGTSFVANTSKIILNTTVGLEANGTVGTAGQVLHSNGSTVYWSNTTADITAVSAGDGLSGGGTEGDLTLSVLANNGIVANSTGVFAKSANGISVDSSGINVVGGAGLVSNSIGVHVGQGNGVTVDADSIRVVAGTGVVSNATGVHIGQAVGTTDNVTFANVVTSNLSVTGTVSSNLMPLANNTYHLGNTTTQWAQVHAANVHGVTGIFDGNVEIAGDLLVSGNVTTTNVSSLIVADAKILLAANNPGDILDIGFSGTYTDGGSTVRHAGLFRDASDNGVFKFFSNTVQDLTGNNVIDIGEASYAIGTLQTYLVSSGLRANSSVTNITANSSVSVAIVANTLTLTTALAGNSGGTGRLTTTNNALLVGNSTNGYDELTLGTDGYVLQSNGSALVFDILDGGTF